MEAMLIATAGVVLSLLLVTGLMEIMRPWLSSEYGLFISSPLFGQSSAIIIVLVLASTYVVSLFPAVAAYKRGLHAGLNSQ